MLVLLIASPPQRMSPPCRYSKFVVARLALNAVNVNEFDAGCEAFAQVSKRRGDEWIVGRAFCTAVHRLPVSSDAGNEIRKPTHRNWSGSVS
jgi:hypothetical protein